MDQNICSKQLVDLSEEQKRHIVCPICEKVLNIPVITVCCHTFCKTCLMRVVINTNQCPVCELNIPDYPNIGWILNTTVDNLIQTFKIKCNTNGCNAVFAIKDKANHRCDQKSKSTLNLPQGLRH